MNLRDREYSILGKYYVFDDTKEVFSEEGELLCKLPKLGMKEAEITDYLAKKSEK